MNLEEKLGYRTQFRRRRLLVCFHTANHLVLGLNVHFLYPQYITELFSYKCKKERKKQVTKNVQLAAQIFSFHPTKYCTDATAAGMCVHIISAV